MNKDKSDREDELWSEYDLKSLRIRRLGSGRKNFSGTTVRLEPDVAEMFPNADAVNEALRSLIRIMQEKPAIVSQVPVNTALDLTDEGCSLCFEVSAGTDCELSSQFR